MRNNSKVFGKNVIFVNETFLCGDNGKYVLVTSVSQEFLLFISMTDDEYAVSLESIKAFGYIWSEVHIWRFGNG